MIGNGQLVNGQIHFAGLRIDVQGEYYLRAYSLQFLSDYSDLFAIYNIFLCLKLLQIVIFILAKNNSR